MRLEDAQRNGRGTNNFDLLRLTGAILVLFAHSFDLTRHHEPLFSALHLFPGSLGVEIFFAISGFLIARSFAFEPRQLTFWVKRALRIVPGLAVSILLAALVLGPLVSTTPLHTYLLDPATKAFVLDNLTFQTNYALPGVFAHNLYPGAVNGSLWTLPVEIKAYAMVAVLGLAPRRWFPWLLVAAAAYLAALLVPGLRDTLPFGDHAVAAMQNLQAGHPAALSSKAGAFELYARPFACFGLGAALFALRRRIPLRWWAAVALLAACVGAGLVSSRTQEVATAWALPYLVLVVAYGSYDRIHLPAGMGDYSYGIYIYAFPVQQLLVHLGVSSGWILFLLATPVTVALAAASWRFVEAPALTIKSRLAPRLGPMAHAAESRPAARTELDPEAVTGVPAS